jgi:cyclase
VVHAQSANGDVTDLGHGLYVLTVGQTNVLVMTDADGVALVDGGHAAHSAGLVDTIAALRLGDEIHTLFNTHWHPDQTGLNETVGRRGGTIVSHENTRLWLTTDVTWPWSGETVQPLPEVARPNKTFYDDEQLITVGDRSLRYGRLTECPHTDGDIYVLEPDSNVLAVGDAVCGEGWPAIDWWTGGWIGGVVGGLDALLYVAGADTRIVPARGPLLGYSDLETQYEMYQVIFERLAELLYGGAGPEDAVAAKPTEEFDEKMGHPDQFVRRAFRSMWPYLSPDA